MATQIAKDMIRRHMMGMDYYGNGYFAGKRGAVGRPPYDPRDPMTMKFVNLYNQGFNDGMRARHREVQNMLKPKLDLGITREPRRFT